MARERVSTVKPEVAFYYPGQYWGDPDWVKNLILFFDGVAMLIPEYMSDHGRFEDYPIIASLKEHDLFHVVRPEESIGKEETEKLAKGLAEVIASGCLDHLTRESRQEPERSSFGSLSMSRLGYSGDEQLARSIVEELKARGLASDSDDGVSIPLHRTVRALILVLLSQILRSRGESMGLTLSPTTDQWRLVEALNEVISKPASSTSTIGDIVSFDMAMVGVNLAGVPMDEVLDFRNQNYAQHRNYSLSVRRFARDLSIMPVEERKAAFEQRQEELDDAARAIRSASRKAWGRPISFAIGLAGAAWTIQSGEITGGTIAAGGGIAAFLLSMADKAPDTGVYSYIFSARRSLY